MKRFAYFPLILAFIFLFCHKSVYKKEGLVEVKKFEWQLDDELNRLNFKYYLADVPVDTIVSTIVRLNVDGIIIENRFPDPTIILDMDENSERRGEKCIMEEWIPSIPIRFESLKNIELYLQ